MNTIYKFTSIFMVLIALIIYYFVLGPSAFPDYDNYITIVTNGGYLFSSDEYIFEYISRKILTLDLPNASDNVDLLAILSQIISISYLILLSIKKPSSGLIQCALTSVVFLTTTLRAAPAYLLVGYASLTKRNLVFLALLALIAFGWHDTAIIPFIVIIFVKFLTSFKLDVFCYHLLKRVYWVGILFFLLHPVIRDYIIIFVGDYVGIRDAYLTESSSHGSFKLFYMLLIYLCTTLALNASIASNENKVILMTLNILSAVLYALNGVAGLRFSTYCITFFLASYIWPKSTSNFSKVFILITCIIIYIFSYFDILKNSV